jgi:threonine aldolase
VPTGTAANALALAHCTPPWGAVYCHAQAHINADECGAPEFFSNGGKLVPVPGEHGKLTPEAVAATLGDIRAADQHRVVPSALSLTQSTEAGTVYGVAEAATLADLAHRHGLAVHMDGARFANAVAALGCAPADITWRAGIDVLAFGATKVGAVGAEAILFFDPARAADFVYRRKRAGHLLSRMRFVAAQFDAVLADGLWLRLAGHANAMAARLAAGIVAAPGSTLLHPVEANEVFARLPDGASGRLRDQGFRFYDWGPGAARFVTSFATQPAEVDALIAALEPGAAGASAAGAARH